MAKENKCMLFFYDWEEAFEMLTGEECKTLILAMIRYHRDGSNPPELTGAVRLAASFILPQISRAKEVSEERAEAGRRGGRASVKQRQANSKQNEANGKQSEATNTNTNTNTNTTTTTTTNTPSPFGAFWDAYPKKVRRRGAEREWEALSPDSDQVAAILSAIEGQKQSALWQREEGRYIPDPSNWLKERRWEDELSPSLPKQERETSSFTADEFFEAALRRTLETYSAD